MQSYLTPSSFFLSFFSLSSLSSSSQEDKAAAENLPHDSPLLSPNTRSLRSFAAMDGLRGTIVKNQNRGSRDEQKKELLALIEGMKTSDTVSLFALN